jgi:hypothetical protein
MIISLLAQAGLNKVKRKLTKNKLYEKSPTCHGNPGRNGSSALLFIGAYTTWFWRTFLEDMRCDTLHSLPHPNFAPKVKMCFYS